MHLHDLERELREGGWVLIRIRGSHRHYCRVDGRRYQFAAHGTNLSPTLVKLIRRQLRRMAEQHPGK